MTLNKYIENLQKLKKQYGDYAIFLGVGMNVHPVERYGVLLTKENINYTIHYTMGDIEQMEVTE